MAQTEAHTGPTAPVRAPGNRPAGAPIGWRRKVGAFVALTKPRIIELLLITTVPTMMVAADGWPGLWLVLATVVGGALAAGSANAYNMWWDRDIDAVMKRTRKRPLVTGDVTPVQAVVFASVLAVASVLWLGLLVNWVAAWLALAANVMYSVGYTMLLKRHTSQNIVWGGAAGCMPVLIGWAAVTGGLDWTPVLLFGMIFFWTPPHYWPLSMKFKDDYAAAGVPMLPVVADNTTVARQIVLYAAAMVACSLALVPVGGLGWFYAAVAVAAGAWFMVVSIRLQRRAASGVRKIEAMSVFHGSITYLTIVFVALAIDPLLPF
ncbi:heme o synthase [Actinotalea caeni]|uniref:heme o synthase n=1 Tax=Actinotalea caeni TaxID=1348467 RepID=UPI0012E28D45